MTQKDEMYLYLKKTFHDYLKGNRGICSITSLSSKVSDYKFLNSPCFDFFVSNIGSNKLDYNTISPLFSEYLKYIKQEIYSLGEKDKIQLFFDSFKENENIYCGQNIHSCISKFKQKSMEDETLFNGQLWSQVVALIGLHFQKEREEIFIKSKLEKLIKKNNSEDLLFKLLIDSQIGYNPYIQTIFKIKQLEKEIKTINT